MISPRSLRAALLLGTLVSASAACAQQPAAPDAVSTPEAALTAALSAACRANQSEFASYLTPSSAVAFRALPAEQRVAFVKRFSLSDDPGRVLVSSGPDNHPVVRCEAPQGTTEFRFHVTNAHDNLASIAVDVKDSESVQFGLVRQDGAWRLLSLGLVLLDVPQLSQRWAEEDLAARERSAVGILRGLASAIDAYRRAYGKLPDSLQQLGPAPKGEISPDQADLIDSQLATGSQGGYRFRFRVVSSPEGASPADATFEAAATPDVYGASGRQSFFIDTSGKLHAADKHGALASASDPLSDSVDTPPAS